MEPSIYDMRPEEVEGTREDFDVVLARLDMIAE